MNKAEWSLGGVGTGRRALEGRDGSLHSQSRTQAPPLGEPDLGFGSPSLLSAPQDHAGGHARANLSKRVQQGNSWTVGEGGSFTRHLSPCCRKKEAVTQV